MRHRLFTILSTLSLALLLCLLILWPISYYRTYGIGWESNYWGDRGHSERRYGVFLDFGRIDVMLIGSDQPEYVPERWQHWPLASQQHIQKLKELTPNGSHWRLHALPSIEIGNPRPGRLGFDWQIDPPGIPKSNHVNYEGSFPCWFLLLLTAVLPARQFDRYLRYRHRARRGLCFTCGYDLRAHQPGQHCPECGTSVPESPSGYH